MLPVLPRRVFSRVPPLEAHVRDVHRELPRGEHQIHDNGYQHRGPHRRDAREVLRFRCSTRRAGAPSPDVLGIRQVCINMNNDHLECSRKTGELKVGPTRRVPNLVLPAPRSCKVDVVVISMRLG